MTGPEYLAETDTEPDFEYPEKADLMPEGWEDMDDDQLRIAEEALDEKNKDFAMCEGFSRAYGENFRDAFPKKYYQALHQGRILKYNNVRPIDYI